MNGSLSEQARKVGEFTEKLASEAGVPVEYRDESMTTLKAKQLMRVTRKKKRREKERDDAIAAAYILQDYLDEGKNA